MSASALSSLAVDDEAAPAPPPAPLPPPETNTQGEEEEEEEEAVSGDSVAVDWPPKVELQSR